MAGELVAQFERRRPGGPLIAADLVLPLVQPAVTVLFGPSGCGKTTALRCLAGLERPQHGVIRYGDEVWFDGRRRGMTAPRKRRIGYVSQDDSLFLHISVEANVAYGVVGVKPFERRRRVHAAMELMAVGEWSTRRPDQLSGGQRQRVALARALAPCPRLVLLDEPLTALDVPARAEVRALLRRVLSGLGAPTILVTHDRSDVLAIADRVAVMSAGRMLQVGSVQDVFSRPASAAVAALVGVENVIEGRVVELRDGLCSVRVGGAALTAVESPGVRVDSRVLVCIRPEAVTLRRDEPGRTSARNQLVGRVAAVEPAGVLVRIELDCGFRLAALVTRASVEDLRLAPGEEIAAAIKAPAVHLIPH